MIFKVPSNTTHSKIICIKDSRKKESTKQALQKYILSPSSYTKGKIRPPHMRNQAMVCGSHMPTLQPFLALLYFLGPKTNLSSSFLPPPQILLLPPAIIISSPNHDSFHPGSYHCVAGKAKGQSLSCMKRTRIIPLGLVLFFVCNILKLHYLIITQQPLRNWDMKLQKFVPINKS